ncbi:MAG: type II secretion system F family protein [Desulfuromonadales bacterium]|nr:type II secretion system F family protein [Desulfuromonadales bacterium]
MTNLFTSIGSQFGNLEVLLIQLLVFCSVSFTIGGATLLLLKRNPASKRLSKLVTAEKLVSPDTSRLIEKDDTGFFARITGSGKETLSPSQAEGRRKMRTQLFQAGFTSKKSYRNYLAIRVTTTILLPVLFLVRSMFFRLTPEVLVICLALAALGYLLPGLFLKILIQGRQKRIARALPDALDLMVICVEAGLGLDMTFKRVGDEIRPISPDLSDEFYMVNREVRAGRPRTESFKNLGLRTGVVEVQNLMALLTQTSRFGTSMAKALRVHANAMRIKRRQLAEERAGKAAVKLTLPLMFCIFPAIMVVLAGPAALRIMTSVLPSMGGG